METNIFVGIAVLCGIFAVGEIIAKHTKFLVPSLVFAMFVVIILGGQLGILPEDLVSTTGFTDITYTWGLPFLIAGFGTSITVKGLRSEGRTCAIAILTVILIVALGALAGITIIDMRSAIFGTVEVAGGGQAAMIFIGWAQEAGDAKLVALVLCVMNMQFILGYPLCSWGLRRSMGRRILENRIPENLAVAEQAGETRQLIKIPAYLKENFFYVFFVLAAVCWISGKIGDLTSLSPYIFYIILGFLCAELGLVEHNCFAKLGCTAIILSIVYLSLMADFITMKLSDVGEVALAFFTVMIAGLIGNILTGFLSSKVFKIDFFEAFALSIACMVGYPVTLNISDEAMAAVAAQHEISEESRESLLAYYTPKVVISGVVSISLVTGILAGFIVSFL